MRPLVAMLSSLVSCADTLPDRGKLIFDCDWGAPSAGTFVGGALE